MLVDKVWKMRRPFGGDCPWLHALQCWRQTVEGYIVAGRQCHMRPVRVCMFGEQCNAGLHKLGHSVSCTVYGAVTTQ